MPGAILTQPCGLSYTATPLRHTHAARGHDVLACKTRAARPSSHSSVCIHFVTVWLSEKGSPVGEDCSRGLQLTTARMGGLTYPSLEGVTVGGDRSRFQASNKHLPQGAPGWPRRRGGHLPAGGALGDERRHAGRPLLASAQLRGRTDARQRRRGAARAAQAPQSLGVSPVLPFDPARRRPQQPQLVSLHVRCSLSQPPCSRMVLAAPAARSVRSRSRSSRRRGNPSWSS